MCETERERETDTLRIQSGFIFVNTDWLCVQDRRSGEMFRTNVQDRC